jgi:hypothetical protein
MTHWYPIASLLGVVLLCTVAPAAAPATQPTTARTVLPNPAYPQVIARDRLITGGQFVADPAVERLRYYVAPQALRFVPGNADRLDGLFVSADGGETWRVLSKQFDFRFLYVHPATGRFYAIIGYEWQQTGEDGFLQRFFADKVVTSADGRQWRDITRGPGHVADLVSIFRDPDHPARVCVGANVLRYVVLQYTDDDYTDWKWVHGSQWTERHPATRPAD